MTGLLGALCLGAGISVLAGGLAWAMARTLRRGRPDTDIALWRSARLVAVLPVFLALAIYAVPQTVTGGGALPFEPDLAGPSQPLPFDAGDAAAARLPALPPVPVLLLALYLAGLAISLCGAFARHLARRRMIAASRMAEREERRPLDVLAERIGVRAPELRIGPDSSSPLLTGWRGVILVPAALLSRPDALRFALAHELSHFRRGDERDRP